MPLVPGGRLMLMADQDLQFGGGREQTTSQYSYILQSGDLASLRQWYPKVAAAFRALPELTAIDARDGGGAQQITLVVDRSEEHTSELQSLMRISYAVFCLKKKSN